MPRAMWSAAGSAAQWLHDAGKRKAVEKGELQVSLVCTVAQHLRMAITLGTSEQSRSRFGHVSFSFMHPKMVPSDACLSLAHVYVTDWCCLLATSQLALPDGLITNSVMRGVGEAFEEQL